jgi:hypothetical protein
MVSVLTNLAHTAAYTTSADTSAAGGIGAAMIIFWLVIAVVSIVAMWKVYAKAGQPGWAAIIPFYNIYVLLKIVGRPGWWLLLFLIPLVNIIISLVVSIDLAKAFGKSEVFGVIALWFFSIIGYLMLGFGDAQYKGAPTGGSAPAPQAPVAPSQPAA